MPRRPLRWLVLYGAIFTTLMGKPEASPLVDWNEPFTVNGIALADGIQSVLNRLGAPVKVQMVGSSPGYSLAEVWSYRTCRIKLMDGRVVGIVGSELSQRGIPVVKTFDKLALSTLEFGYPLVWPRRKSGPNEVFRCNYHPVPGIGIPSEMPASMALRISEGQLCDVSLFEEKFCQSDLSPSKFLQLEPLPRLEDKLSRKVPVRLQTSKGQINIDVYPESNPPAAQRFMDLVRAGFYDETPFYNVFPGFAVEFGINWRGNYPEWRYRDIPAEGESVRYRLEPGTVVLDSGSCTRITINLQDLTQEQPMWNDVIGRVSSGLEILQSLQVSGCPGFGLHQGRLWLEGDIYLSSLPYKPDTIVKAQIGANAKPGQ